MDVTQQPQPPGWGLAIATLVAIIAAIVINTLSNLFPPGGENVGQIANTVLSDVLIIPANYAFAIWGLIYLGLIGYGIYQLGPERRGDAVIRQVDWLLIAASVAQVIWIFLFTLKFFGWSILAMLGILLALVGAYLTLRIGQTPAHRKQRWFVRYPFSIYLAWISVATIVNVASALYVRNWQLGLSDVTWTVVMLVVSAAIAALVILTRHDIAFTLVFLWAYGAIAIANTGIAAIWITAAVVSVALLILLVAVRSQSSPALRTD